MAKKKSKDSPFDIRLIIDAIGPEKTIEALIRVFGPYQFLAALLKSKALSEDGQRELRQLIMELIEPPIPTRAGRSSGRSRPRKHILSN